MSILQDPTAGLSQAKWYLDNQHLESFPGAFELAAGNLCRQILEQVLFILCFYSGMSYSKFMRKNRTIKTAKILLDELNKISSGRTYWDNARKRGLRIAKFVKLRRSLRKWQRHLNEPSHFSVKHRALDARTLNDFISLATPWFDDTDHHLIVAAANAIFSRGRFMATLGNDPTNTPGISIKVAVSARDIVRTPEGGLVLASPLRSLSVISSSEVPRGRWPRVPLLIQGCSGIRIEMQLVNRHGQPVNISNFQGILESFATTKGERVYLIRRMRELGLNLKISEDAGG